MLLENVIESANNKSKALLPLATQLVLKLVSNKTPKTISKPVATYAKNDVKLFDNANGTKLFV